MIMSKKHTFFGLSLLIAMMLSLTANADEDEQEFVGLWQGIDPTDGSVSLLQITCDHNENSCFVRGADSFSGLCGFDRLLLSGDGVIEGAILNVQEYQVSCVGEDPILNLNTTYSLNPGNDSLIEKFFFNGVEVAGAITYNKISHHHEDSDD